MEKLAKAQADLRHVVLILGCGTGLSLVGLVGAGGLGPRPVTVVASAFVLEALMLLAAISLARRASRAVQELASSAHV